MKNKIKVKGHLQFDIIDLTTKKVIQKFSSHNLVVNTGILSILNGLAGNTFNSISKYAVGTSGASENVADVNLTNKYIRDITLATVEEDKKSVTFNFNLDSSEYNGNTIGEMGLYLSDNITLFSRRVIAVAIKKTPNIAIQGSWTITLNQE